MPDVTQFGAYRFNEVARFNELASYKIVTAYLEGRFGIRVAVYEPHSGVLKAVYDSQQEKSWLRSIEFEFVESGCGPFAIHVNQRPDVSSNIERGDIIDIYLMSSAGPWFSGRVEDILSVSTSGDRLTYRGHGLSSLLSEIIITEEYENEILSDVVKDLFKKYLSASDIRFFPDQLMLLPYTVRKVGFDRTSMKKALKSCADLAHNYVYGVDEERRVFFRPRMGRPLDRSANKSSQWIGYQLHNFRLKEDTSKITNKLHVKIGKITGGSNFAGFSVEDLDSIAFFGEREAVLSAPEIKNEDDARLWAEYQLETRAWPKISGTARNLDLSGWVTSKEDLLRVEGFFRVGIARSGLVSPYYEPLNGYYRWKMLGCTALYGANWLKREFLARVGGQLGRVELMIQKVGSPGDLTVTIKHGSTTLAAINASQSDIPEWFQWSRWDLSDSVTIQKKLIYTIELKAASGDSSNYYRVLYSSYDSPFSGGYYGSADSGGSWTENTDRGLIFRTYLVHADEFILPIKRVRYKADPTDGIRADIDLGEVEMPLEDRVLKILRDIKAESLLQQSNVADLV